MSQRSAHAGRATSARGERSPRHAVALLVALGALAAPATGCRSAARALGFGAPSRPGPEASVEIRNTIDVGVNVYVMTGIGLREAFLGQVGAGKRRRIQVGGATPGTTVWLRARPVDGRADYVREDVVLGPQAVWRIP